MSYCLRLKTSLEVFLLAILYYMNKLKKNWKLILAVVIFMLILFCSYIAFPRLLRGDAEIARQKAAIFASQEYGVQIDPSSIELEEDRTGWKFDVYNILLLGPVGCGSLYEQYHISNDYKIKDISYRVYGPC